MKCKMVQEYLPMLAVRELEGQLGEQISEHLETCAACRNELAGARKIHALLALKRYEQPDEFFSRTFLDKLHQRLEAEERVQETWWSKVQAGLESLRGIPAMGVAAAAACLMLFLSVAALSPTGQRSEVKLAIHRPVLTEAVQPAQVSDMVVRNDQNVVYVLDRVASNSVAYEPSILTF
ncbi:MAG: hypothetical protein PHV34_13595 [Verrucomicrobiae bacterium]|nr:hypothetical protein [Verrucomicrobiae bacterium]